MRCVMWEGRLRSLLESQDRGLGGCPAVEHHRGASTGASDQMAIAPVSMLLLQGAASFTVDIPKLEQEGEGSRRLSYSSIQSVARSPFLRGEGPRRRGGGRQASAPTCPLRIEAGDLIIQVTSQTPGRHFDSPRREICHARQYFGGNPNLHDIGSRWHLARLGSIQPPSPRIVPPWLPGMWLDFDNREPSQKKPSGYRPKACRRTFAPIRLARALAVEIVSCLVRLARPAV